MVLDKAPLLAYAQQRGVGDLGRGALIVRALLVEALLVVAVLAYMGAH
jgi:hypothetical protein